MCTCPNYAIYFESKIEGEASYLKFLNLKPEDNYRTLKAKYQNSLISLPCGQCEECRKAYATEWAVRCALEASQYKYNWFITLTYDDVHYRDLNKEDIQEFLENLNPKHEKVWFKYWLAGEIGPRTGRAHYHMILMNYDIKAKPIYATSEYGKPIYQSDLINKAWGKGFVQIQAAEDGAMAYCAKYANKSAKEFNFKPMMSKGIGLKVLEEKQDFINKYGYIQGQNGKKWKIPRYYFKKIVSENTKALKKRQIQKAKTKTAEHARRRHLEYYLKEQQQLEELQKGRRSKV